MLLMVLSWCLIRGGALEIRNGELFGGNKVVTWSDTKGDFVREGGRDARLSLVSARKSLCARTCERASRRGGVLA